MIRLSPAEMAMAKHVMKDFFMAAINIGLQAPAQEAAFGHPVSRLIKDAAEKSLDVLSEELLTAFGDQGEYPLNGSGLKLLWGAHFRGPGRDQTHIFLVIYCDHSDGVYPTTIKALKETIKEHRCFSILSISRGQNQSTQNFEYFDFVNLPRRAGSTLKSYLNEGLKLTEPKSFRSVFFEASKTSMPMSFLPA